MGRRQSTLARFPAWGVVALVVLLVCLSGYLFAACFEAVDLSWLPWSQYGIEATP